MFSSNVQITSYGSKTYSVIASNGTDITSEITLYDVVERANYFGLFKDSVHSYDPMDATYNLCIN